MKSQLTVMSLLAAVLAFVLGLNITLAHAQSEIFLCDDGHGSKEYKNNGATKGCKKIDLPGITTIPGLPRKPAVVTAASKPSSSPADFPKVDSGTQFIVREHKSGGVPILKLFSEGRGVGTLLLWVIFFMSLLDLYFLNAWMPTLIHDSGIEIGRRMRSKSGPRNRNCPASRGKPGTAR